MASYQFLQQQRTLFNKRQNRGPEPYVFYKADTAPVKMIASIEKRQVPDEDVPV
jgi:hypothetical protein